MKTKLHPRGDDPYQVLERINNNAYKIDLSGEFSIHSTFNVTNLTSFDVGDDFCDLRMSPFEEGENDKDYGVPNVPTGSITQSKAKRGKMIRITVFQMFQLDLLHEPRPRRFNKYSFFIYKIG